MDSSVMDLFTNVVLGMIVLNYKIGSEVRREM